MKKTLLFLISSGILISGATFAQDIPTSDTEDLSQFDVTNATSNIKDLKSSVDEITKELFELDDKERKGTTGEISQQYKETRDEIVNIINTINTTTDKTEKILRQISAYKKEIDTASTDLKETRSDIEDAKGAINNFTQLLYKLNNKIYDTQDNSLDLIKTLTNSDNLPRTIANNAALESLTLQFKEVIGKLDTNQAEDKEAIIKYSQIKNGAQQSLRQYQQDLSELQQKKSYLVQFLNLYKKDKFQRQETIAQLFQSSKSVYEKIQELLKEIKKGVYTIDFNVDKKIKDLNDLEKDTESSPLAWPIYPIYEIQSYFGDSTFQKQFGVPQLGMQIKAEQNTPIYAARNGIVYFMADGQDMGISWVMIAHTDGYVTVYQYLNTILIKQGDIVRRGQLIGYSGGEPGTNGAGFISRGPNLSFMVFKDGVALDPFDILDASIVQDKSVLPEGYQIKYLRDKYARPIDISSLPIMTGETLYQREQQFLRLYGVGVYSSPSFREEAVKGTNIDQDVVMCIAFAESTLGKYLTTTNNIGNVGNDDRGNRIGFNGALMGARAIPLTLNNGYLGHYHTIKQLSRYGNPDGKIYASSPINWQTNVLKCLSQVKGYYIPEDFPFRVGENPRLEEQSKLVELIQKSRTQQ